MTYEYSYWRARPTERDFNLDIVSRHPEFDGRKLRKFALDGIETIGVWGDEPFEINFTNNSYEDVQVRVSLDGTDVMTGKQADLEVNHAMWLVRAGRTLHLRAWHETQEGGARFVFTGADKSVALHTHGDMSHKGMISVAVFTDANRPTHVERTWRDGRRRLAAIDAAKASLSEGRGYFQGGGDITKGGSAPVAGSAGGGLSGSIGASYNVNNIGENTLSDDAAGETVNYGSLYGEVKSLKKEAAVGAGEYVSQRTHTVRGLEKPVLNSILRVRYMWWDDVMAKLKTSRYHDPHPTGFPADKIKSFADLSGVPRTESAAASRTVGIYSTGSAPTRAELEPVFDRLL
jgi:hypothetical protein